MCKASFPSSFSLPVGLIVALFYEPTGMARNHGGSTVMLNHDDTAFNSQQVDVFIWDTETTSTKGVQNSSHFSHKFLLCFGPQISMNSGLDFE